MADKQLIDAKALVDDITNSFKNQIETVKSLYGEVANYAKEFNKLPSQQKNFVSMVNQSNTVLTKEQEILQRNLKTYNDLKIQKETLNRITSESTARMNESSKASNGWFSNMSGGLKQVIQLFGVYSASMLAHRAIMGTIGIGSKLSDDLAQLAIYLKNNSKAADEVFASLTKIKTRTSLSDLLGIAEIVAKKGVVQNEIKGITEEFDKMFLVLGDKLGDKDTAIASVVKLISIFNSDGEITKGRVKDVADSMQYLTTSGVATGDFLIRFSERLGAVRSLTGQSMPEILGLGAGFEQLGLKAEVASNATGQIIAKLLTDLPKYAKMAGIPLQEFKNLMETNSTEGLIRFAEGIEKNSKNAEQFSLRLKGAQLQGVRVKSVLAEIAINGDLLRNKVEGATKAVDNMNKTFDSSSLKQKTFAATLDQIKKQFEIIISSKDVQDTFSNIGIAVFKVTEAVLKIPFGLIVGGLTAWSTYKLALNAIIIKNSIIQGINNLETAKNIAYNNLARTGILGRSAAEAVSTATITAKIAVEKANLATLLQKIAVEEAAIAVLVQEEVSTGFLIAEQKALLVARRENVVALGSQVVATEAVIVANEGLMASMSATGIGAIAVAIGLVVYGLYEWANAESKVEENARKLKDLQSFTSEALSKGNDNTQKALDQNIKINEDANRQKIINQKMSNEKALELNKEYEIKQYEDVIENYRKRLEIANKEKNLYNEKIIAPKFKTRGFGDRITDNTDDILAIEELNRKRERELSVVTQNADNALKQMQKYKMVLNKLREKGGDDYNPDEGKAEKQAKQIKEITDLNFKEVKSEIELKKAILERQQANFAEVMNDDTKEFDVRLKARSEFGKKTIELLDLQYKEENLISDLKRTEDLQKNLDWQNKQQENNKFNLSNGLITSNDFNNTKIKLENEFLENVKDINFRADNELSLNKQKLLSKLQDNETQNLEFEKKINDKKIEFSRETSRTILKGQIDDAKKIADNEKLTLATRQHSFEKYLELKKKELEIEEAIELSRATSDEERGKIIVKYFELFYQLNQIKSPFVVAKKEFDNYLKDLSSGQMEKALNDIGLSSLKMFLDFDDNGETTFSKMFKLADSVGEKFAVVFQGVGDVFQEVMNKVNEISNQRFANQLANLEKEKEVSLLFAGDSVAGRQEIERQYREKEKEIKRREFKAKQKQAIFNILIDTAQGVAASLARGPVGVPMAIVIGALGLAQSALVATQQIPEFYKGTENAPEGFAKTNEKGREIITDDKGNIKDYGTDNGTSIKYLKKGDKVKTASWTKQFLENNQLDSILKSNNIDYFSQNMPSININNSNGMSKDDFNKGIESLKNTISNKREYHQTMNENGIKSWFTQGNTKVNIMNAEVRFQPKDV